MVLQQDATILGDLDEIAPAGDRDGVRKRLLQAEVWEPPVFG